MSNRRTTKCTYQSRYGGGWVTPAQFITEELCASNARDKGRHLPERFWTLKDWANFYRWQIKYTNDLLKKYRAEAIVKALRDPRLKDLRSLSPKAKWKYQKVFDEYQAKVIAEEQIELKPTTVKAVDEAPRPSFGGKNQLARLDD